MWVTEQSEIFFVLRSCENFVEVNFQRVHPQDLDCANREEVSRNSNIVCSTVLIVVARLQEDYSIDKLIRANLVDQ